MTEMQKIMISVDAGAGKVYASQLDAIICITKFQCLDEKSL